MIDNNIYPIQVDKRIFLDLLTKTGYLFLFCLALSIFLYLAVQNKDGILWLIVPGGIFLVLFIIVLIMIAWNYIYLKSYKYECRSDIIYLSGGIVSRFEKNLPYPRIQHVVLYETFWQRVMKISSISIETARESGAGIFIPDLLKRDAIKLKDYIISKSSKYKPVAGI